MWNKTENNTGFVLYHRVELNMKHLEGNSATIVNGSLILSFETPFKNLKLNS